MSHINFQADKKYTDYRLLVERMESDLFTGEVTQKSKNILADKKIWNELPRELLHRWALLCQVAGMIDTARDVYALLTRKFPEYTQGWKDHLEFAHMLNPGKAKLLLVEASRHLPGEIISAWQKELSSYTESNNHDIDAALLPFEEMKATKSMLETFLSYFSGREDAFARQWVNKETGQQGYVPVRRPMMTRDVEDHLNGKTTYGIYLLQCDGNVNLCVIDADLTAEYRKPRLKPGIIQRIKKELAYLNDRITHTVNEIGTEPLVEFSGSKGYHFWFFFSGPISARQARSFIQAIINPIKPDLQFFRLEGFPKQDQLTKKGFGNLVKLPLGIHRKTGKRSRFIKCHDSSIDAQIEFLKKVRRIDVRQLSSFNKSAADAKIAIHPRMQKWAQQYPELYELENKCPPLGHIIASCREKHSLSEREEKVLFQTIGFLPKRRLLLHYLCAFDPDYNPHLVDYKISRLRGTPLGCRRIHSILEYSGDFCTMPENTQYMHPLLHLDNWKEEQMTFPSEKGNKIDAIIESLKIVVRQLENMQKRR